MTDADKLRLRAEWARHGLHDVGPRSVDHMTLRAEVAAFGAVLAEVCKEAG